MSTCVEMASSFDFWYQPTNLESHMDFEANNIHTGKFRLSPFEQGFYHNDLGNTIKPWQMDKQCNLFQQAVHESAPTWSSAGSTIAPSPTFEWSEPIVMPKTATNEVQDQLRAKPRRGRPRKTQSTMSSECLLAPTPSSQSPEAGPLKRPRKTSPRSSHLVPHTVVEKRYRIKLGNHMEALQAAIPTLRDSTCAAALADQQLSSNPLTQGLKSTHKKNKATVCAKAVEYIQHLEARIRAYEDIKPLMSS